MGSTHSGSGLHRSCLRSAPLLSSLPPFLPPCGVWLLAQVGGSGQEGECSCPSQGHSQKQYDSPSREMKEPGAREPVSGAKTGQAVISQVHRVLKWPGAAAAPMFPFFLNEGGLRAPVSWSSTLAESLRGGLFSAQGALGRSAGMAVPPGLVLGPRCTC